MKIEGIHHIVIAVRDLKKAEAFFSNLFETTFDDLGAVEQVGVRSMMSPEGIEIMAPLTPESELARFLERRGEGVYAVSFRVDNPAEAGADAERKGVRVIGEIKTEQLGTRYFNIEEILLHPKDAYGVHILLTKDEVR